MIKGRMLLGVFVFLGAFGLASLFNVLGRPSVANVRAVDVVQINASGMIFGSAHIALCLFPFARVRHPD